MDTLSAIEQLSAAVHAGGPSAVVPDDGGRAPARSSVERGEGFVAAVLPHLASLLGVLGEVSVAESTGLMPRLRHDDVVAVVTGTTGVIREMEALRAVAAGVAAQQSGRDAGHSGLAQKRGHRSAVTLVQELTGISRTQAGKITKLGQTLLETAVPNADAAGRGTDEASDAGGGDSAVDGSAAVPDAAEPDATVPDATEHETAPRRWDACLGDAFTHGLSFEKEQAIRRGLGEPPVVAESGGDADATVDANERTARQREASEAWAAAATQLIDEASRRTVEELAAAARDIRDLLDPEGAARRFEQRHQNRAFRIWKDADGVTNARVVCDDAGAAWLTAIQDAALRPRRGGPRFVDPAEKAAADELVADPRTNDQLAYDLMMDVIHTGALADAKTVFGTRQSGIRVVVTEAAQQADRAGRAAVALIEETNTTVPAAFAAQHACDTGSTECHLDHDGNPLYLGREARLFTAKQRLTLSIRDGGCGWPGCDRPASFCEAHHIDPYSEGGKTDVDRGILLCRFHHMNLHHHGWRITRRGRGKFVLHPPGGGAPIILQPRLERRYAFGDLQPPTRFRRPPTPAAA